METIAFKEIDLCKIKRSGLGVRSEPFVDPDFVGSVREGLIEPIVVREIGDGDEDGYELVCGYRRLVAAEKAGLKEVNCKVMRLTDLEAWMMMVQENEHRRGVPQWTWPHRSSWRRSGSNCRRKKWQRCCT